MENLIARVVKMTCLTVLLSSWFSAFAQGPSAFLRAFDSLSETPVELTVTGQSIGAPSGGHIQGIQQVGNKIFLSGSSADIGYLAILRRDTLTDELKFLGVKPIAQKPLNHAGGFQITDGWLALGCENTKTKKQSLIVLQDVSSGTALAKAPDHDFERTGKSKVSTAGAVGLLKREDHFLLAVATWDALTVDFYTSNHLDPTKADFEFSKWTTWDARMAKRKGWVDKKTNSYQNIQLFEDEFGIFLVGTTNTKGNVADVFEIDLETDIFSMMKKLRSRTFEVPAGVSFRNAGGLVFDGETAQLLTVGRTLKQGLKVAVFE